VLFTVGPRREPADVVDALSDCHDRIRAMTTLAGRLAAARDLPADDVRDAAARVRRYFDEALVHHVADEEQDILPRLAGRDPAIDDALATMRAEHADHEPAVARLVAICAAIEADPEHLRRVAPDLAALAAGLDVQFAGHLALEERVLFPAIRALPQAEQDAIWTAMKERRA
jgi:iron-sulfur cluster repair protein YtfE (RIC family)